MSAKLVLLAGLCCLLLNWNPAPAVELDISGEGTAVQTQRRVYTDPQAPAVGDVVGAVPAMVATTATSLGTTYTLLSTIIDSPVASAESARLRVSAIGNGTLHHVAEFTPTSLNLSAMLGIGVANPSCPLDVLNGGHFSDGYNDVWITTNNGDAAVTAFGYWGVQGSSLADGSVGYLGYADAGAGVYGYGESYGVFGYSPNAGICGSGYIGVQADGSTYGIYSSGGMNYFSGDVGVGTTSPAYKLDVNGTASATAFIGNGAGLTHLNLENVSGVLPVAKGGTGVGTLANGGIMFGGTEAMAQDSAVLFWDHSNKRLGIGTATPSQLLSLNNFGSDTSILFQGGYETPTYTEKITNGDFSSGPQSFENPTGWTSNDLSHLFWDDGDWNWWGAVGFVPNGYTQTCTLTYAASSPIVAGKTYRVSYYLDSGPFNNNFWVTVGGTNGTLNHSSGPGTEDITAAANGTVVFNFRDASGTSIEIGLDNVSVQELGTSATTQNWSLGSDSSDSSKFKIAGSSSLGTSDLVAVLPNGNVGIGTNSPAYKLDVNGTAHATSFDGDGSALTGLNAESLSTGSIPDARLSSNVALNNGNNTLSGVNTFNGGALINNSAVGDTSLTMLLHMDSNSNTGCQDWIQGILPTVYGTPATANLLTDTSGRSSIGNCMQFDGVDDRLTYPSNWNITTGDFSVAVWFKSASTPNAFIIAKANGYPSYYGWGILLYSSGMFRITVGSYNANIGSTGWLDNKWHHAVFVFNRSSSVIQYIDGIQRATVDISAYGASLANAGPVEIGKSGNLGNGYYSGALDEMSVWSRSLSPSEIRALYSEGTEANPKNTTIPAFNLSRGFAMSAERKPMLTRSYNPFTSGIYNGVGRWGLFMEDAICMTTNTTLGAMVLGLPNNTPTPTWANAAHFAIKSYNADSTVNRNIAMFTNDWGVGIGDFDKNNYPFVPFAVQRTQEGPISRFTNTYVNKDSWGLEIKCGLTTGSQTVGNEHKFMIMKSNNGQIMAALMAKGSSAGVYYLSDERVKKNIAATQIDDTSLVNQIDVIDYDMADNRDPNARKVTGFSAQNLAQVYPDAVVKLSAKDHGTTLTHGLNEVLMISPTALLPLLMKNAQTNGGRLATMEVQTAELTEQLLASPLATELKHAAGGKAGAGKGAAITSDTIGALLPDFTQTDVLVKMQAQKPESLAAKQLAGKKPLNQFTGPNEAALDPASLPVEVSNYLKLLTDWTNNTNASWVAENRPVLVKGGGWRARTDAEIQTYINAYQSTHKHPDKMTPEELGLSVERLSTWNYQAIYDLLQRLQVLEKAVNPAQKTVASALKMPDYVFEAGYQRMTLEELKQYIQANKHLPGIPARKEVESKGLDRDALQMKLLEKIEELSLYAIEQQEALQAVQQASRQQQERIAQLEQNTTKLQGETGELREQLAQQTTSFNEQLKAMQAQLQGLLARQPGADKSSLK